MDSFTDMDIFSDLQEACRRRLVPVYILLDQAFLCHFLEMCKNLEFNPEKENVSWGELQIYKINGLVRLEIIRAIMCVLIAVPYMKSGLALRPNHNPFVFDVHFVPDSLPFQFLWWCYYKVCVLAIPPPSPPKWRTFLSSPPSPPFGLHIYSPFSYSCGSL